MKITLFTSNNLRHNYFINLLSNHCKELWVIQECRTMFTKNEYKPHKKSSLLANYFNNVQKAQKKIFPSYYLNNKNKNLKVLSMLFGELSYCDLNYLKSFLNSDLYIVLGSSYIKGKLVNYLIKNKTINIHAGITPYYRGSDCNFWALYDDNPHLVGSTIHLLAKGLDNGSILYHSMTEKKKNIYEYTMSTLKSAFVSIVKKIDDKSILKIKPTTPNILREIRYTKKIDFSENVLKKFLKKKINLNSKKFNKNLLVNPFFLKN